MKLKQLSKGIMLFLYFWSMLAGQILPAGAHVLAEETQPQTLAQRFCQAQRAEIPLCTAACYFRCFLLRSSFSILLVLLDACRSRFVFLPNSAMSLVRPS